MKMRLRNIFIFCVLCITANKSVGQLSLHLGYNYLKAQEWDDIVHTYNFSRPWINTELKPLTHGYEARLGWLYRWNTLRSIYVQPQIGFRQFTSSAANDGEELYLRLRQYTLQCDLNFSPKAFFGGIASGPIGTRWMMYFSPAIHLWQPYASQNEKPLYVDGVGDTSEDFEEYTPSIFTWSVAMGTGYRSIMVAKKFIISPKFGVRYFLNTDMEDFDLVVSGSNQTGLKSEAKNYLIFESGLEIVWIFKRTKSGKGYGKPCSNC